MWYVIQPTDVDGEAQPPVEDHNVPLGPTPMDWSTRYGGCPWLYGPVDGQAQVLREVLESLKSSDGCLDTEIHPSGSPVPRKISWFSRRLGPSGVVKQTGDRLELTPQANEWLRTQDPAILCGLLHSRLRFFGEILAVLDERHNLNHSDLSDVAKSEYGQSWTTLDPVRKRVGWLRSLGLVEKSFAQTLSITAAGAAVMERLQLYRPEESVNAELGDLADVLLPEAVEDLLAGLTQEELAARKVAFGYVPRSSQRDVYESLRWLTLQPEADETRQGFCSGCVASFGVKESSAVSALYTMKSLGLIEQYSMDGYRPTPAAKAWIDGQESLALVAIVHAHLLCTGELLPLCAEAVKAPDVRRLVADTYGVQLKLSEVRSRLHLLHSAGAIELLAPGKYRRTPRGYALTNLLPLLKGVVEQAKPDLGKGSHAAEASEGRVAPLVEELRLASIDSVNPSRFERAVQAAMAWLGYRAQHLGGAGRTDVLVEFEPEAGRVSRFIIDTKASSAGLVNDGMVKFDALRDHLVKHDGKFAVLVAHGFGGGRVVKWAKANGVSLVTVDVLAQVLFKQEAHPVGMQALTEFFKAGDPGLSALEDAWRSMDRSAELAMEVVDRLRREYEGADTETAGSLTGEQLYFLLRDSIEPRPTKGAITLVLELLSSPLLMGVERQKNASFLMADPPIVLARRLRNIAGRLEQIDREGSES